MPVKVLLETRDVNVEAEDLSGEGMLGGQGFGAPDALLPEGFSHAPIMGLWPAGSNRARSQSCSGKSRLPIPASASVFPPRGLQLSVSRTHLLLQSWRTL